MTTLKASLTCPNCKRTALVQVKYDDLSNPYVNRCDTAGGGCGKYFAVKLNLRLEAECCKIFEGADSGKEGRG